MVKPVGVVNSVIKQTVKANSHIDKTVARERLVNLIKEFEEVFKSQPNNEALAKHIESLKEALKTFSFLKYILFILSNTDIIIISYFFTFVNAFLKKSPSNARKK